MAAPKIFLCHAKEDAQPVKRVHTHLTRCGFHPWLDEFNLRPGQRWELEIRKAIRESDFVIVFLSSTCVSKRGFVHREIKLAMDTLEEFPEDRVYVIPVKLDECVAPTPRHFRTADPAR